MKKTFKSLMLATSLSSAVMLSACAGMQERLSRVGEEPSMTAIQNPYKEEGYRPVSLPMPPQEAMNTHPNSLWQTSRQTFFKDQRAHQVGDILTVMINIEDEADFKNKTERTRTGDESGGLSNLLGLESLPGKVLPGGYDTNNLIGMESSSKNTGDGKIKREEDVKLKLAAMVTQVLPNGNFVIRGKQEVRVNFELRELTLDGVIRPEDILNNNSVSYEKIAEARISYGGRGTVSDVQQPRYGQQIYDAVFPF
jgi:flagellar L-ring protein precursor FlgH